MKCFVTIVVGNNYRGLDSDIVQRERKLKQQSVSSRMSLQEQEQYFPVNVLSNVWIT